MKRLILAAAVTAAFAAPSAFANSSANASLGPISVTLYDLNPLDGISASITFASANSNYAYTYSYLTNPYDYQSANNYGNGPWDPVSSASSTSYSAAAASLSGSTLGSPAGAVLSASSSSTNPVGVPYSDYASSQSGVGGADLFTLSANTLVVFSAAASVTGSAQNSFSNIYGYGDYASAAVYFNVSGVGASGNGSQNANDSFSQSVYGNYQDTLLRSFSQSQSIGASFLNLTSGNLAGNFDASVSTNVYSYAAAVPEPETYAMLLAGLGLIGGMARRKAKKS